jgi:hypoxanthine phosphoribosyltransferase
MQVKDKQFEKFILRADIEARIAQLALSINEAYHGKNPVFISVLNGSFMFAGELMKYVTLPSIISFVKVRSYQATKSTGKINSVIGLQEDIKGKDVVVIEDIVDTGYTMDYLIRELKNAGAASVEIATLLFKPEALVVKDLSIQFIGFEIPNKFVLGYGLDYDGYGRNYPDIYKLKE